jgi:hypothetical protein
MLRATLKFSFVTTFLLAAAAGLFLYQKHDATAAKLRAAEKRNDFLKTVVARLTSERRVADVIVTDQAHDPVSGKLKTTLLFVEYARDGATTLPPKSFTIEGNVAHLDALVVKFAGKFVEENDPLKGHSVALFTRLYGESQAPENAFPIDARSGVPDVYRSPDAAPTAEQSAFEHDLWSNFWRLADDASYRASMGVRVAQGEGVWSPFLPGRLYTVSIESDGGLNLTSEPLKGIYREAMKRGASAATTAPASE